MEESLSIDPIEVFHKVDKFDLAAKVLKQDHSQIVFDIKSGTPCRFTKLYDGYCTGNNLELINCKLVIK